MLIWKHSAKKLGLGEDILLSTELHHEKQYITCYVMCDEIGMEHCLRSFYALLIYILAGTQRSAELRPGLSASVFPAVVKAKPADPRPCEVKSGSIVLRRQPREVCMTGDRDHESGDDERLFNTEIDDAEMFAAGKIQTNARINEKP